MENRYKFITSPHKIDNYDSVILEDRAFLDMEDTSFKLEYQIGMLEDDIAILDEEISGAKLVEDEEKVKLLSRKKLRMERQLKVLMFKYTKLDFASKVIALISLLFKKRSSKRNTIGDYMLKHFWSKVSKKMKMIYELKTALEKLGNINRSVDELISMQAPVKGAKDRYERLTSYISKANNIHSEISNNIKLKTII
ncbi:hypothetical protein IJ818_02990 [bacterium]|nr:hypothetical protein [bacterium]